MDESGMCITIARWMGWTKIYRRDDGKHDGMPPGSELGPFPTYRRIPDFTRDLNAISQAEEMLEVFGLDYDYGLALAELVGIDGGDDDEALFNFYESVFKVATAAAKQRATALCKLIDQK